MALSTTANTTQHNTLTDPTSVSAVCPPPISMPFLVEKVPVGLERLAPVNDIVSRVLGPNGANLLYISNQTGVFISLCGKGSGNENLEGAQEPMHIRLQHHNFEVLEAARQLAVRLVESIRQSSLQVHPYMGPPLQFMQLAELSHTSGQPSDRINGPHPRGLLTEPSRVVETKSVHQTVMTFRSEPNSNTHLEPHILTNLQPPSAHSQSEPSPSKQQIDLMQVLQNQPKEQSSVQNIDQMTQIIQQLEQIVQVHSSVGTNQQPTQMQSISGPSGVDQFNQIPQQLQQTLQAQLLKSRQEPLQLTPEQSNTQDITPLEKIMQQLQQTLQAQPDITSQPHLIQEPITMQQIEKMTIIMEKVQENVKARYGVWTVESQLMKDLAQQLHEFLQTRPAVTPTEVEQMIEVMGQVLLVMPPGPEIPTTEVQQLIQGIQTLKEVLKIQHYTSSIELEQLKEIMEEVQQILINESVTSTEEIEKLVNVIHELTPVLERLPGSSDTKIKQLIKLVHEINQEQVMQSIIPYGDKKLRLTLVPHDVDSLYASLAHVLIGPFRSVSKLTEAAIILQQKCVHYIRLNKNIFFSVINKLYDEIFPNHKLDPERAFEDCCRYLSERGHSSIKEAVLAVSTMFNTPITIFYEEGGTPTKIDPFNSCGTKPSVSILYRNGRINFDAIDEFITHSSVVSSRGEFR